MIYSMAIITHINLLTYTGYALIHLGKRVHGDLQIDQHLFFMGQFLLHPIAIVTEPLISYVLPQDSLFFFSLQQ